jgi:hypothetical protein
VAAPASAGRPAEDRAFYRQLREALTECARAEFELSARQGDGATLREHLRRHAKNTGKVDERLQIQWPREGKAIWMVFNEMGRQYTGFGGALPVSMTEIDAWQRVHRIRLTPWELEMIHVFDALRQETERKHRPARQQKGGGR